MNGFSVLGVQERQELDAGGKIIALSVITIETDLGNVGQLKMPTKQLEAMDDNALRDALELKAANLDRAQML